jgi:hypothetical protein
MRCRNRPPTGETALTIHERREKQHDYKGGLSNGQVIPDGPPIGEAIIDQSLLDVRECLERGRWGAAESILHGLRFAVDPITIKVDGPKLSSFVAEHLSMIVWVWLYHNRNARFAASAMMCRKSDPAYTTVLDANSTVDDVLAYDEKTAHRLGKRGIRTAGHLAECVDQWRVNSASRPGFINNSIQSAIEQELRRHNLEGPVTRAYYAVVKQSATVEGQRQWAARKAAV